MKENERVSLATTVPRTKALKTFTSCTVLQVKTTLKYVRPQVSGTAKRQTLKSDDVRQNFLAFFHVSTH